MPKIIISYDDTANDRDAAALGRLLSTSGSSTELAYVRHSRESDHERDQLQENDARDLLGRGAELIGNADATKHVVLDASTGEGLWALAERENADVVVFGSDYRTANGAVQPGTSARRLLNGGPAAIAIAPAGLRDRDHAITRIGVTGDDAAEQTARALAAALGATVVGQGEQADLLVVGSRPEAQAGRVMLSAAAEYAVETASAPVLIVAHGTPVAFGSGVASGTATA